MSKITIEFPGDRSVGIPDCRAEIEWPFDLGDDEEREMLRMAIKELVDPYADCGRPVVFFHDECLDCGRVMEYCRCPDTSADFP